MSTEQQSRSGMEERSSNTAGARGFRLRWLLSLVVIGGVVAFGVLNRAPVSVRPIGQVPMYQVLSIAFVLGMVVGWILRSRVVIRLRGGQDRQAQ